jgi:hypothetical protein
MEEKDFEGTLVLENLAEIGKVEDFYEATDSDDIEQAYRFMKKANIDQETINFVFKKLDDEA